MKKLTFILALLLTTGCARLVSKETETILTHEFINAVVQQCPSPDPLSHRSYVVAAVNRYAEDGNKDVDQLLEDVALTCYVANGLGGYEMTEAQLAGYRHVVQTAWLTYQMQYRQMATQERRRRAAYVQNAGRTMMDIQRTDDLNRIRRNQEAGL